MNDCCVKVGFGNGHMPITHLLIIDVVCSLPLLISVVPTPSHHDENKDHTASNNQPSSSTRYDVVEWKLVLVLGRPLS